MHVRQVRAEDLSAITSLEACCFPKAEAASKKVLKERIEAFSTSFFVMEAEGEIIGMINGCVTDQICISDNLYEDTNCHKKDGSYQSIFGLDIHPCYRHKGYAKDLMYAYIEHAKREYRKGMILTCKQTLIHFYEQFGFLNMGVSNSVHGGVVWYDMLLNFEMADDE